MRSTQTGLRERGLDNRVEVEIGGDADDTSDAELAYADMLADDGADAYEVRVRCRWARTRRSR